MLKQVDLYYFSPTGGTKKAGMILASQIATTVNEVNLAEKVIANPSTEVIVVAVPVFGGRIPAIVSDKIANLTGEGKKAITVVVYGVRAYEDALLELNDAMVNSGFDVVASAALVAQHSIVAEVGMGRPDQKDAVEIQQFAKSVLETLEKGKANTIVAPGNYPYKDIMNVPAVPLSLDLCGGCGYCAKVCPTDAITVMADAVTTDSEKCILCMACVAKCPVQTRILPPSFQAGMTEKLGALKDVRRENEFYI